jgi:hypothetical protein
MKALITTGFAHGARIQMIFSGSSVMDNRITRLLAHQKNIERYQNLLRTNLSEIELHYIERRLSEERFAIAMLDFMDPSKGVCTENLKSDYSGDEVRQGWRVNE